MKAEVGNADKVTPPQLRACTGNLALGHFQQAARARIGAGLREHAGGYGGQSGPGGKSSGKKIAAVHGWHISAPILNLPYQPFSWSIASQLAAI